MIAKNVGKSTVKNIIQSLNRKYSLKLLDHAKQSATDAFKTFQKESFKK